MYEHFFKNNMWSFITSVENEVLLPDLSGMFYHHEEVTGNHEVITKYVEFIKLSHLFSYLIPIVFPNAFKTTHYII